MINRIIPFFLMLPWIAWSQITTTKEFTYNEFLGYVKKYHPLVKAADLRINEAQANLMMARGGFDPRIEVDFDQKKFKDTEYYSILNSSFKIPTWYGIEVKAGFDNSEGIFLNPENSLPNQGLTSLGISIPVGQGLFINQRMADVRKAKIQQNLNRAERQLEAVQVLFEASLAYFQWKRNYDEVKLYENFLNNARVRYFGIRKSILAGDKPGIDSIEAGIVVKNRRLSLVDSQLKLVKARLNLSNYLWLENNIPLELQEEMYPEEQLQQTIVETLRTNDLLQSFSIDNHPKMNALRSKIDMLNVERQLKANMLLPKIDLGYSYLSEPSAFDQYRWEDYKVGVNVYFPIFLRKERGNLRLTKYKIQDAEYQFQFEKLQLTNKITAQQTEINSLTEQISIIGNLVNDNLIMLNSEEKLFSFGESSVFLINTRENNLVTSQLNKILIENRYFESNAELFKIMANPD